MAMTTAAETKQDTPPVGRGTRLLGTFTVTDAEVREMGDLGAFWRAFVPENEPLAPRAYRVVDHATIDTAEGRAALVTWLWEPRA
jgi:hypothetical protein